MIFNFVARILRAVVKLTLLAFGLVMMLGLLLLALAGLLLALLRFVFTGRKPVAFTAFTQFRQASQQFRRGGQSGHSTGSAGGVVGANGSADIVDVQAREVSTPPARPGDPDSSTNAPLPLVHEPKG